MVLNFRTTKEEFKRTILPILKFYDIKFSLLNKLTLLFNKQDKRFIFIIDYNLERKVKNCFIGEERIGYEIGNSKELQAALDIYTRCFISSDIDAKFDTDDALRNLDPRPFGDRDITNDSSIKTYYIPCDTKRDCNTILIKFPNKSSATGNHQVFIPNVHNGIMFRIVERQTYVPRTAYNKWGPINVGTWHKTWIYKYVYVYSDELLKYYNPIMLTPLDSNKGKTLDQVIANPSNPFPKHIKTGTTKIKATIF